MSVLISSGRDHVTDKIGWALNLIILFPLMTPLEIPDVLAASAPPSHGHVLRHEEMGSCHPRLRGEV